MRLSLRRRPTVREDAAGDAPADPDAPPGLIAVRVAGMGGNKLKECFLASPAFKQIYEDAYRVLYAEIYGGGKAWTALAAITKVLTAVDGYDAESTSNDAEQLRTIIQQRTASLAENEVIRPNSRGLHRRDEAPSARPRGGLSNRYMRNSCRIPRPRTKFVQVINKSRCVRGANARTSRDGMANRRAGP